MEAAGGSPRCVAIKANQRGIAMEVSPDEQEARRLSEVMRRVSTPDMAELQASG